MFCYALDNEYISINPMADIKFDRSLFRTLAEHAKETQIYNSIEKKDLVAWCEKKFTEIEDIAYLLPGYSAVQKRYGDSESNKTGKH